MAARAYATFTLYDDTLTGAEITRRLGLQPTRVHDRGDLISPRNPNSSLRQHTTWALTSALPDTEELIDHLSWLLDHVEPRLPAVRDLCQAGCAVRWVCFVTAKPTGNAVWLETETLSRIVAIGGALVLDLYDSEPD